MNVQIKKYMEKNKLTQSELARLINSKQQAISRYVNGDSKIDIEIASKLADVFHISLDELAGRETNMININSLDESESYLIKKILQMNKMQIEKTKAYVMGLTE